MTTYLLLARNPSSKKLWIMSDERGFALEYPTKADAETEARQNPWCVAWGSEVVAVDPPT